MDNLRIILMVLAILAIIALVISGFKMNSKENNDLFEDDNESNKVSSTPLNESDELLEDSTSYHDLSLNEDFTQEPHLDLSIPNHTELTDDLIDSIELDANSFDVDSSNKPDKFVYIDTVEQPISLDSALVQDDPSSPDLELNSEIQPSIEPEKDLPILRIYVQATPKDRINNKALFGVLAKNNLEFDRVSQFFIRFDPMIQDKILFKVCNLSDSGLFDDFDTPSQIDGMILFMTYSSVEDEKTLKLMTETAHSIATVFNARILDEQFHSFDLDSYHLYQKKIKQLS